MDKQYLRLLTLTTIGILSTTSALANVVFHGGVLQTALFTDDTKVAIENPVSSLYTSLAGANFGVAWYPYHQIEFDTSYQLVSGTNRTILLHGIALASTYYFIGGGSFTSNSKYASMSYTPKLSLGLLADLSFLSMDLSGSYANYDSAIFVGGNPTKKGEFLAINAGGRVIWKLFGLEIRNTIKAGVPLGGLPTSFSVVTMQFGTEIQWKIL